MERIRNEEVYINWYYHQAFAGWGRMKKITPLPIQISNRALPDYQIGTKFISYETILSTGQNEFLGYKTVLPRKQNTNSSVVLPTEGI
jgi:hypothetical protein